ncbi:MAG: DUF4252 domain-containing protein [Flavobacteriaceae bacterium]
MMRNLALAILTFMCSNALLAQNIFDTYQNNEDVTYVSINPKMFQLLARMTVNSADEEAQEFLSMVSSIQTFKVLVSGNATIAEEMETWVENASQKESLENLMEVKEESNEITFYVDQDPDTERVQKLLMYSKGKIPMKDSQVQLNGKPIESVLLLLEGDIDLDKIATLTEKMDLPGGDQLKKVSPQQ